jgi:1D-myo-inositol 3-kinase
MAAGIALDAATVAAPYDYVTVGHVTVDMLADGSRRPGGGAFYSALQAARLGLRTLIVTRGEPAELEELLDPYRDELSVAVLPATHTTTLRTSGVGATRQQRVLAWAGPITETLLLECSLAQLRTSILHLAPVARETPNRWPGRADRVCLTPQGLVRDWSREGAEVFLVPLDVELLPTHFDAAVISAAERDSCAALISASAANGATLVETAGDQDTTIHLPDGSSVRLPAPRISEPRDDLGAGDVFAAAFFVALRDGLSACAAVAYGQAAAAVRISGVGARAVGDRRAILALGVTEPGMPPR